MVIEYRSRPPCILIDVINPLTEKMGGWSMVTNIITFGTFDIFHLGHLRILQRAKRLGDYLIVGVSTDALNFSKKGHNPVYSQKERMEIIASIRYVDEVFYEESLERKADYLKKYKIDVLVMGDDWQGKFDHFKKNCKVVYLPRTPSISTTEVIEKIRC